MNEPDAPDTEAIPVRRDNIVEQFGADFASIDTNVKYGPIHQFSGQISIAVRSRSMFFKLHRGGEQALCRARKIKF